MGCYQLLVYPPSTLPSTKSGHSVRMVVVKFISSSHWWSFQLMFWFFLPFSVVSRPSTVSGHSVLLFWTLSVLDIVSQFLVIVLFNVGVSISTQHFSERFPRRFSRFARQIKVHRYPWPQSVHCGPLANIPPICSIWVTDLQSTIAGMPRSAAITLSAAEGLAACTHTC